VVRFAAIDRYFSPYPSVQAQPYSQWVRLMGVPALEVGYTSTTTGRGDHEVHKGHVVALKKN
jgi:hypothetical protein